MRGWAQQLALHVAQWLAQQCSPHHYWVVPTKTWEEGTVEVDQHFWNPRFVDVHANHCAHTISRLALSLFSSETRRSSAITCMLWSFWKIICVMLTDVTTTVSRSIKQHLPKRNRNRLIRVNKQRSDEEGDSLSLRAEALSRWPTIRFVKSTVTFAKWTR